MIRYDIGRCREIEKDIENFKKKKLDVFLLAHLNTCTISSFAVFFVCKRWHRKTIVVCK
jgi:hypothetical protein